MDHEFVSFNLMLIGIGGSDLDLWRQGAALASIPIELSVHDNAAAGVAALAGGGADLCVLDGNGHGYP